MSDAPHQKKNFGEESLAVQAMGVVDPQTHAVVPPIHISTTFIRDADNAYRSGFAYGRADNATVRELEAVLKMLEHGAASLAFGSGMSAALAVFLSLPRGARLLAPSVMYWALRRWLMNEATSHGLQVRFVNMEDLDAVRAAAQAGCDLIWVETPSNPLWGVVDLAAVAEVAHEAGARLAVDSTCATPVLTQPLLLGADIVMHSASKYINGHSDVVAGVLVTRTTDELWERIEKMRASHGMLLGPFEAFLVMRGLRTMHLRVRAACANALDLAHRFQSHPLVADVLYPGLATHPQHEIASRQMKGGFGGMLSVRVRGGEATAIATAAGVRLWKRATSLGGVESLLEHRASVEGAGSPCPDDLLRLSCGIELADDLYADLDAALRAGVAR
ncbi:MAG: aminotransferase class V-fold PLP-dependent enzyme [Hyphomicrobiales bacterium]|nr:aminotransferase class V-fold PLP-dependent enzyme [Hyphomicrobiales bacterium]